jgi:hypothetical protein
MILDLIYIAIILVFIIDYSGFITTIEEFLSRTASHAGRKIHIRIPRPFSCALCAHWWSGLIYIIVTANFSFKNLMFVALISASTIIIAEIMAFIRDLALTIISKLRQLFKL